MKTKYMITHPGAAHMDDLLSLAVILVFVSEDGNNLPLVYRREPTQGELDDPDIIVFDVGGRYEAHNRNFDHHQLPRDVVPTCALTLVARYFGVEESLRGTKWFPTVEMIDSKGPFAWAKANGLEEFPMGLSSPIEGAMKERLEAYSGSDPVGPEFLRELLYYGNSILKYAQKLHENYLRIKRDAEVVEVLGVRGLYYPEKEIDGLDRLRDELSTPGDPIGFAIVKDDRGEGLTLYRFNDDRRLDFYRLASHTDDITFAHTGGFIAKTRHELFKKDALALVWYAVI